MVGQGSAAGARRAAVAGSWYPGEPAELRAAVETLLAAAAPHERPRQASRPRALVVPHAGLVYSGPTAAYGFALLAPGDFDRVIVLAPSHRYPLRGAAADPSTQYETPLGPMPVDTEAVAALARCGFAADPRPFVPEHAIEMQLPFLRVCLPDARLVPVLVGELRGDDFAAAAAALAPLLDDRTLVVVSSDFTHFGPHYGYVPFTDDVQHRIRELDAEAIDALAAHDFDGFQAHLRRTGATICGRRPLGVLLRLLPPAWRAERLHYATSGEMTGDPAHSVSYACVAFMDAAARLTVAEQRTLLFAARQAMEAVHGGPALAARLAQIERTPRLAASAGVFVSLHRRGSKRLRGCIGALAARSSLLDAVTDNAVAAATRDPRFDPVKLDELADLDIEISVLGPVVPVGDVAAIEIGRDGLVVTRDLHRGVLLPQVAAGQHWSREEFLDNVCRKAGLPAGAWRQDATIERFEAEVFSETEA